MIEQYSPESGLRSLYYRPERQCVEIIDQTLLPQNLEWRALHNVHDFCEAIETMRVRGAPLIGITAAFGLALELAREPSAQVLNQASQQLLATRPTAVNLSWALQRIESVLLSQPCEQWPALALQEACAIAEEDVSVCRSIGEHGYQLISSLAPPTRPLQIMTHCNAGWLAALEWGTALAPIYVAAEQGRDVHVWVSETRPRNQGASLTCWELQKAGIAHTLVADNACGHLLQAGRIDCVIVGSDRTVANGDVCNKIGTWMKALAARASQVPFYVALPASTIDWSLAHGAEIPIEERSAKEVLSIPWRDSQGREQQLNVSHPQCHAHNPAFDVTPAALVDSLVTEFGCIEANTDALSALRQQL